MFTYQQAVDIFGRDALGHPKVVVTAGGFLINDGSHAGHDESNPDDGTTSALALEIAKRMEKYGITSEVHRLEE